MESSRRNTLKILASLASISPLCKLSALANDIEMGNFQFIYSNREYKQEFLKFLVNVFHLYPEHELHQLIASSTTTLRIDQDIYQNLQPLLDDISSIIAPLTYAMPALKKQKQVMAEQCVQLLQTEQDFSGYLEIGTIGRYLDELEERFNIRGARYFIPEKNATYSPVDMIDRGQISKAGIDITFNNYQPDMSIIAPNSLDLVTIFIGFHHCPIHLRESFIGGIAKVMRKGAALIVRDHNVINAKMNHMVGLAHDVFNMGTAQTWQYNRQELRHFYSLVELDKLLNKMGFVSDGRKLYQQGDPTLNALMLYRKI